ncbi:MAG TPA: c-type cytochrome [Methylophaga aminisulfidivorans]|uniref:C-type cytochrome n=1 Tax=Methylophaga aminisulfidivorans TaxID=230105 RepID=A0A7C1ZQ13_9GAMM|nr:c-type cytochrome [Methylophaga aminisulfidivorans]
MICRKLMFISCLVLSPVCFAQHTNTALLASACAACHGTNGHSVGGTPSLAGLDEDYFFQQMQQFQSGKRASSVMQQHALGYKEDEIRELAKYFAGQK